MRIKILAGTVGLILFETAGLALAGGDRPLKTVPETTRTCGTSTVTMICDRDARHLQVGGASGNDDIVIEDASVGASTSCAGDRVIVYAPTVCPEAVALTVDGFQGDDRIDLSLLSTLYHPIEIFGGVGNDHLLGSNQADWIRGGPGNDHIEGRAGDDIIDCDFDPPYARRGGAGHDRIDGGGGNDNICRMGRDEITNACRDTSFPAEFVLTAPEDAFAFCYGSETHDFRLLDLHSGSGSEHGCSIEGRFVGNGGLMNFRDGLCWPLEDLDRSLCVTRLEERNNTCRLTMELRSTEQSAEESAEQSCRTPVDYDDGRKPVHLVVQVFEHANFNLDRDQRYYWETATFIGFAPRIPLHDTVSSVKVLKGPNYPENGAEAELCEDVNYGGRCVRVGPGEYPHMSDICSGSGWSRRCLRNDEVDSVRIITGDLEGQCAEPIDWGAEDPYLLRHRGSIRLIVRVYEDSNYGGKRMDLIGPMNSLPSGLDDRISSIKVWKGPAPWLGSPIEAAFYEHPNQRGELIRVRGGDREPSLSAPVNDAISSIDIP